jgi:hypothetical protein
MILLQIFIYRGQNSDKSFGLRNKSSIPVLGNYVSKEISVWNVGLRQQETATDLWTSLPQTNSINVFFFSTQTKSY